MDTRIFTEKAVRPDEQGLRKALGKSGAFWMTIKTHLKENYGDTNEEWKFYSPKSGWTLKVLLKKRNLFFFMPMNGYFRIAFVFGDKAVTAVEKSDLPDNIKKELKDARKYAEGRGIRIEVKRPEDAGNVIKLIDIKVAN